MNSSEILSMLTELKQTDVISKYNSSSEEEKKFFEDQINNFEKNYPGGLREYLSKAKALLTKSYEGKSLYENYIPSIPEGKRMKINTPEYYELEAIGMEEMKDTCFCLVAGGLGERLGYSDIKIGIETDLITKRKFFDIYSGYILAYEHRLRKKYSLPNEWYIPFGIMTSDDTNDKTIKLFKENNYFGLKEEQIYIVKQEKCPALLDNECHLALKEGKLELETKPHGHGDVHMLLYGKGVAEKWLSMGKKWLVFFQDTNALAFLPIPSAIGTSKKMGMAMNSLCIKRRPGEALGSLCRLTKKKDAPEDGLPQSMIIHVEYNELESFLKMSYNKEGDVPNSEGYSDFPGGLNILVFDLKAYYNALIPTKGIIPEFVNPKYADATKTKFKAPTRLECMMPHFVKLFKNGEKVGFCDYEKLFCFSTVKNKIQDGLRNIKRGIIPESAFSCEQDIFLSNIYLLKDVLKVLNIKEEEPEEEVPINDGENLEDIYKVKFGPKLIIYPSFAVTLGELKEKIKGKITLNNRSTLILKEDIKINSDINVNGILTVDKDVNENIICENKKRHIYIPLKKGEGKSYEKIRGYTMKEE